MKLSDAAARKAIEKWARILQINQIYAYKVTVNNAPDPDVKKSKRKGVQAHVKVDEAYYCIRIVLNAYNFEADELDHVIVHELLHVVLARISTLAFESYGQIHRTTATNLVEATTEQLAQAFIALAPKKKAKR